MRLALCVFIALCIALLICLQRMDAYILLATLNELFWRPAVINTVRAPFLDTSRLRWCQSMRNASPTIRMEWDQFVTTLRRPLPMFGDILPAERELSGMHDAIPGKWRTAVLRLYGRDTPVSTHFPKTCALLNSIVPQCTTAMFSVLESGRRLPTHRGPNYAILRYHLAIQVPENWERCSLTVGGRTRHWQMHKDILFDDTLPHSAENLSSEDRVVLFLDVPRPFINTAIAARITRFLAYNCVFPYHDLIRQASVASG